MCSGSHDNERSKVLNGRGNGGRGGARRLARGEDWPSFYRRARGGDGVSLRTKASGVAVWPRYSGRGAATCRRPSANGSVWAAQRGWCAHGT
jgi:hypothetical protein